MENTTLSSDTGKPCSYYVIEKRGFPVWENNVKEDTKRISLTAIFLMNEVSAIVRQEGDGMVQKCYQVR